MSPSGLGWGEVSSRPITCSPASTLRKASSRPSKLGLTLLPASTLRKVFARPSMVELTLSQANELRKASSRSRPSKLALTHSRLRRQRKASTRPMARSSSLGMTLSPTNFSSEKSLLAALEARLDGQASQLEKRPRRRPRVRRGRGVRQAGAGAPTNEAAASQFGQALDLRDTYKTRQPVRELEPRLTMMPAAEAVRDESLVHEVLFSFAPFLGHEPGAIHARRRWHCRSGRRITP